MLIGDKYSDQRLYRGIIHKNSYPLTSEDLHENSDTLQRKNAHLLNNLLGSGTLNEPELSINNSIGVSLKDPSVVLIDGDIVLIQSDTPILKVSDIISSGITDGVLCVLGWYQSLNFNSTLRNYGGVRNGKISNDLYDSNLQLEVSDRCQFRWDTIILSKEDLAAEDNFTFIFPLRNSAGDLLGNTSQATTYQKLSNIWKALVPNVPTYDDATNYMDSDLYIIPILKYSYQDNSFNNVVPMKALKPKGSSTLLKSIEEPSGDIDEGTIWYNPTTLEFKSYIAGVGFIPINPNIYLAHDYNTVIVPKHDEVSDVDIIIGIELNEGDLLEVAYDGLLLTRGVNYEVSEDLTSIKLLGFQTEGTEEITFHITKLVTGETPSSGGKLIMF